MAAAIGARITARGWPASDEVIRIPAFSATCMRDTVSHIRAHSQRFHPLVAEVWRASERLAGSGVLATPFLDSQWLAGPDDGRQRPASVLLKLENRQVTGSFKARGAVNKVTAPTNCLC